MTKLIFTAFFLIIYFQAIAQTGDPEQIERGAKLAKEELLKSNFTPFGNGAFSNVVSNISLSSALNAGENAKIEAKYKMRNWWTAGLSLDQKLGKSDKQATFYDLNNGISPGTTLGFNIQTIIWNPKSTLESFRNFDEVRKDFAKGYPREDWRTIDYEDIMNKGTKEQKARLLKTTLKKPIFLNLKLAFTKASFAYATDSVNLERIDETHFSPSIGLSVGLPFSTKSYFAVTYLYTESYESADELNFSRPFGTSGNTFSQTIAFGPPIYGQDHRLNAEYRKSFGKIPGFALAPMLTYGIKSKIIGFNLPIYFIQGATKEAKPNGLQGGINLGYVTNTVSGWSSFKDGFVGQLILTAPFSIFEDLL